MCGRNEKDKALEAKIKERMNNAPELIKKYINSIWLKKTANTKNAYLGYLLNYNDFLMRNNIDIISVKPMDIDDYISEIMVDKNGKTNGFQIINARLSAITSFYNFLIENQLVSINPCGNNKKLKVEKNEEVTYLTPEEITKLKWFISKGINRQKKYIDRDLAIIDLGCTTGLRVSAIINIDIDDINFEERSIMVVEKGRKKREVYFGKNTEESLKKWINTRSKIVDNSVKPLFINKLKTRMSKESVGEMLKSAVKEAGINKKITPHKMRSTCGMNLYGKTGDIYLTQSVLGHENINNTKIYVKATEEQRKKAANILDDLG